MNDEVKSVNVKQTSRPANQNHVAVLDYRRFDLAIFVAVLVSPF